MATTSLVVELLVVGAQALLWVIGIPLAVFETSWVPVELIKDLSTGIFLVGSAIAIAVAYSIGVAVERVADVLPARFNDRIRRSLKVTVVDPTDWSRIHYAVLHRGLPELVRVTEYIRSRIRFMRSLMINAPLAGVAGRFGLSTNLGLSIKPGFSWP